MEQDHRRRLTAQGAKRLCAKIQRAMNEARERLYDAEEDGHSPLHSAYLRGMISAYQVAESFVDREVK